MLKKIIPAVLLTILICFTVAAYGLLTPNVLGYVLCVVFVAALFLPLRHTGLAAATFAFGTIIVWGVVSLSGLYEKATVSPEQRLLTYHSELGMNLFAPNASLSMEQGGDLVELTEKEMPVERRDVAFLTDNDGFRGSPSTENADVVLVGGSFVYGSGNTQADTLAAQLRREHGINARMLSVPGDLLDYAKLIRTYANEPAKKVVLFLSEDTDFDVVTPRYVFPMVNLVNMMKSTHMARFFQLQLAGASRSENAVIGYPLENRVMAFARASIKKTTSPAIESGPLFAEVVTSLADVVDHIVFIPSKYRVYNSLLDKGDSPALPAAAWNFLQAAANDAQIPCTDLTPALTEAASILWGNDKQLIYWADDTHWNYAGMVAAISALRNVL